MRIRTSNLFSATRALFELWNNLFFTYKAVKWVSDAGVQSTGRFDFIYQRYSRFNWTGVVLSAATGLPLLLEVNGSEVWVSRNWDPIGQMWLLKRFEKLNLGAADAVFTVSEIERRKLIEAGAAADRVFVNPNGADADRFRPGCGGDLIRKQLGIEGKVVIGFTGTFGPWHGTEVLARAATLLKDPARFHLLFVGDGDLRPATKAIIESAQNVTATFVGRVPHSDVPSYLDACDILVSPHTPLRDGSEFFGSPTKLFEYLAMAKPVIASRLGQIADVIRDGETGLLVEPGDELALASSIERMAGDPDLANRIASAARRSVIERHTWRHNAARVFDALENIVEGMDR
jgi:glycosyltransferase involved in cell wall biosynthesis